MLYLQWRIDTFLISNCFLGFTLSAMLDLDRCMSHSDRAFCWLDNEFLPASTGLPWHSLASASLFVAFALSGADKATSMKNCRN
jgi:hypothetical protein